MTGQKSRSSMSSSGYDSDVSARNDAASDFDSGSRFSSNSNCSSRSEEKSRWFCAENGNEEREEFTSRDSSSRDCIGGEAPLLNRSGRIDERVADNFKEIFPLMESFMGQKEKNLASVHRAPLVYTRAPCREVTKKIVLPVDTAPAKRKKNKQHRDPIKAKADDQVQHNDPSAGQVSSDGGGDEPALSMKKNNAELLKLQSQIEELKLKVQDKEVVLQSIKQSEVKVMQRVESAELRSRIEELEKELLRRDFLLHSVQHQLSEKHGEIGNMRLLLQGLQSEIVRRDHRVSELESDLDELQLQIAALRYLNRIEDVDGSRPLQTTNHSPSSEAFWSDEEIQIEDARCRYLAAVMDAKNKPVDDSSIALAAELRHQLRGFISLSQVFPS